MESLYFYNFELATDSHRLTQTSSPADAAEEEHVIASREIFKINESNILQ